MRSSRLLVVLALAISSAAVASEPGQPIGDCADWFVPSAMITCHEAVPWPCEDNGLVPRAVCENGAGSIADNEGGIFSWRRRVSLPNEGCGYKFRTELFRTDDAGDTLIAAIDDVCALIPQGMTRKFLTPKGLSFDEERGYLYFAFFASCDGSCPYPERGRLIRFGGFTTEFEILQTYTPPSALGLRVPNMPEGMGGADRFDTYWGNLSTVGDWSQAHGLQCDYPGAPPSVGDYLEVADTLPVPAPGRGYYYVTSATYQGQTRYGRRTQSGQLSGRDPAVLPACTTE